MTIHQRYPAGGPRGSWPADDYARQMREQDGVSDAEVVMDMATDSFLVVTGRTPKEA